MSSIKPSQLEKGDIFSEDTYPEKYEVIKFDSQNGNNFVIGKNLETGEETRFMIGGHVGYSQPLVLHERG